MRRRNVLLTAICLATVLVAIAPTIQAFEGGVNSANQQYCGTNCHKVTSPATMTMWASNRTPNPESSVTVMVNVTGGTTSSIIGVMLVSTLSSVPASLPSSEGWTIVTDPSGTTSYNWYETKSYSGQASLHWTLAAPSAPGFYTLFARLMHGGIDTFALDNKTGLAFTVGSSGSPGVPTVVITSPTNGAEVSDSITVTANVDSDQTVQFVSLRLNGIEIGNKTAAPYYWDLDTSTYTDGTYVINVTAVDSDGDRGSSQVTVTINNVGESTELLGWVWTMAAGSLAILSSISVLVVLVLMVRKKKMEGRLR